ncbi:Dual specificity protein kinase FUZ7 [Leucoagaricus sp. SymC.cos]|nr:Dual specificity protein kinase FUZ7 [Leucoagaricus sp. SymC.cos]
MATVLRKKRNFRGLQLQVADPPTAPLPPPPDPLQITIPEPKSAAPALGKSPGGKKRPPPMTLKAPKLPPSNINVVSSSSSMIAEDNGNSVTVVNTAEDLRDLQELGAGNGGSVKKVEHVPTGTIIAKKIVLIDAKPSVRKQILRELQIMHDCKSKYIISFYGAFLADPNICICMEFMDRGSLDNIYKKIGAIDIDVVGKVALAVLEGLTYLYDVHRIIHRDIKPSNILCNSSGEIKICDFGVSGELINSIADTFVGTSTYMSPERIQGAQYTVKSDVWSLGISLIELALGRFPFAESDSDDGDSDLSDLEGTLSPGGGMTMSILELLQHIVNEPAPRLNNGPGGEGKFPKMADAFVECCLLKDPDQRWTPKDLLKHEWMDYSRVAEIDLEGWASTF